MEKTKVKKAKYRHYTPAEKKLMLSGVSNTILSEVLKVPATNISFMKSSWRKRLFKEKGMEPPYKTVNLSEEKQKEIVEKFLQENNNDTAISTTSSTKRKYVRQSKIVEAMAKLQKGSYEKLPVKVETIKVPTRMKFNKLVVNGVSIEVDNTAVSIRVTSDKVEVNF